MNCKIVETSASVFYLLLLIFLSMIYKNEFFKGMNLYSINLTLIHLLEIKIFVTSVLYYMKNDQTLTVTKSVFLKLSISKENLNTSH